MSQTVIYYFSGTGNSLAVARDLATRLDAQLIPAVAVADQERIHTEADAVGFVFPIYDFKPPALIETVVRKLDDISRKYLFAVCTYGIAVGRSLVHLGETIEACGGRLALGYGVEMPHNGIGARMVTTTQHETLYANWQGRVGGVCAAIGAREQGAIEASAPLLVMLQPRFLRMTPYLFKLIGQMLFHGVQSLGFTAGSSCDGCGVCARVCPVGNITLVDGRPRWSDHSLNCFACLHWCPKGAISPGGLDMGIQQYHHPNVRLKDMLGPVEKGTTP